MSDREHAHELLDRLEPVQLTALVQLMETMVPGDHETLSEAERKAVAEADEWLKDNRPIPHEKILADLGLTMSDWEKILQESLPPEPSRRNG